MTKTFCARCGVELGYYEGWRVSLTFANDPRPPLEPRHSDLICGDCAQGAIRIVKEAASGKLRRFRFSEAAA